MSLVKSPQMTEQKVAANLRNQQLCHGPTTEEGRERIRAAHLRHGFYSQAEEVAMRALGEDPVHYQELVQGLWEEYNPVGVSQEGWVIRLAQATWLMNRAVRMQEGYAVRQAQEVSIGRKNRLHVRMMLLRMTAERLRRLARSVEDKHYVTPLDDLEKMKTLHQEGELKEMGEITLALFYQLQAPGTDEDGNDPEEAARIVVAQVKEIFGIGTRPNSPSNLNATPGSSQPGGIQQAAGPAKQVSDARYPKITAAEWEARERPRQLLENILKRQVEILEEQRKAVLQESLKGPSPYERAAEIAPTHPNAQLMRRMQDANFREVRRVTKILMKLKRSELKRRALELNHNKENGSADFSKEGRSLVQEA
jgi:hypothetical protein